MRSVLCLLLLAYTSLAQEKSCCAVITAHGAGSGTVIHKKGNTCFVLTNRHVVTMDDSKTPETEIWIIHNRKRYDAKYLTHATNDDLGLVTVEMEAEPAKLASKDAEVGTLIKHWGRSTEYQEGKIRSYTQFAGEQYGGKVGDADYFSVMGDSGAGLFNQEGLLIGVNYGRKGQSNKQPRKDWLGVFVRVEKVQAFVSPYLKD